MKVVSVFILLISFSGCLGLDRWDKRYKKVAEDRCHCTEQWQHTMSPALNKFYQTLVDIGQRSYDPNYNDTGSSYRYSEEDLAIIDSMKKTLSQDELNWNYKLGKTFFNENSELYKCWYKKYSWSDELPPGNTKFTVPAHALEMNCRLVFYLMRISEEYSDRINMIFD